MNKGRHLWSIISRRCHSFLFLGKLPRSLVLAGLLGFFAYSSFNLLIVALPLYYEHALGFSLSQIGTLVGFGFLLNFLAYFTVGIAADRVGGTLPILWGGLGLALTAPFFGLFHSIWLLALVTLGRGFAMSVCALAINAFASEVVDSEQRGAQMGFLGMFTNGASALAPALGVVLYQVVGAQVLFLTSLVAGLVTASLAALLLRKKSANRIKKQFSLRMWLQGSHILWLPASTMIIMGIAWGTILAFMPSYLSSHGVVNPGLFYTAELVSQLGLRTTAGRLSDKYGRPLVAGVGLLLMGLSVFSLLFVSNTIETLGAGLVAGAGWATFGPVLMAWLLDLTPDDRRGLASATYFTAQDIGRVTGSIGIGYVAVIFGRTAPFSLGGIVAIGASLVLVLFAIFERGKGRFRRTSGEVAVSTEER